jgi:opacity protein-like surface antigen
MGLALLSGKALADTTYIPPQTSLSQTPERNSPTSPLNQTESFGFGGSRAAALGYDLGKGFRTELEGVSSNATSERLGGVAAGGTVTGARLTLKGIYEFSEGSWRLKPYIGAGFRAVDLNEHVFGTTRNDWTTAYQVRGGVQLGFTQKLVGSFEYRWTNGSKPIFALAGIPTKLEVDRHGFSIGFNYKY